LKPSFFKRRVFLLEKDMKKAFKLGMLPLFVAAIVLGFSVNNANAQGPLPEILKRMDAMNKSLTSLKADVKMDKFQSQLGETDTSIGTTSYIPKKTKGMMYVRLDWSKPLVENIVIQGEKYQLYRPRLNQLIEGRTSDAGKSNKVPGNALAFMSMSKAQLQANYTVSYLGQENAGGKTTWHLELVPKNKTSYKTAELWVDSNGMPIQAKVIEQNNDSTTVLLSNIQQNVTVSATDFQLKFPANVNRLKA
jgi:outer membrane lipoprotein-sorting protein